MNRQQGKRKRRKMKAERKDEKDWNKGQNKKEEMGRKEEKGIK